MNRHVKGALAVYKNSAGESAAKNLIEIAQIATRRATQSASGTQIKTPMYDGHRQITAKKPVICCSQIPILQSIRNAISSSLLETGGAS